MSETVRCGIISRCWLSRSIGFPDYQQNKDIFDSFFFYKEYTQGQEIVIPPGSLLCHGRQSGQ